MIIIVVGFVVFSLLLQFHFMYRIINTWNSCLFSLLNMRSFRFFLVVMWPKAGRGLLIHEVSRSHTTTHNSQRGSSERVISPSHRPLPDNKHSQETDRIHVPGEIRTPFREAVDLCLRPRGYWDRRSIS